MKTLTNEIKILQILLLLIGICSNLYSQVCPLGTKFINKKYYRVCYSEKYKNPIIVEYKIYKPKVKVSREGLDFYPEPGLITSDNKDYINNPWDKGHMANAQDFEDNADKLYSTFSFSNCAVQYYQLNRGLWKSLETAVHLWAQKDSIKIVDRVFISDTSRVTHKGGAYIPYKFRKTITWLSTKKSITYEFPNRKCLGVIEDYKLK